MLILKSFKQNQRRGVIAPLVAICVVALLAITGLVIDGSLLLAERRQAQSVADSAALAGAQDLLELKGKAQAIASALEYAKNHGYTNDGAISTVTVNIPPKSGPNKDSHNHVEVLVSRRQSTYFIQVVTGQNSSQAGARAVAGVVLAQASIYGLISLDKTGTGVLITGAGGFTIRAPVIAASTSADSLELGGSPSAKAQAWYTNGGYKSIPWTSLTTGLTLPAGGSFSPIPQAIPSDVIVNDPLRNLPIPPRNNLPIYGAINLNNGGSTTLNPGVYTGGITITNNSSVTLNPGLYIIDGGGVKIGNGSSIDRSYITANQVTFFNTGTPATFGGFDISLYSSQSVLSPPVPLAPNVALDPTKGFPGMQLFQDRANDKPVNIVSPLSPLTGTFYAPSAPLSFNGNGVNPCKPVQLIAGKIIVQTDTVSGNAEVDVPYVATAFANPPEIYLFE